MNTQSTTPVRSTCKPMTGGIILIGVGAWIILRKRA